MMLCPLKFSRYEFEGGDECIGAECGFFGGVCDMDSGECVQKRPNDELIRELRQYADDVRYDYNPLDDVFEPDEHLSELCGQAVDMMEHDYVRKGAHSKAQSKTELTLSEQSESLSDGADSREKLEAEILDAGCADEIDYDRIIGWLDRQVAITERECCKYIDGAGCDGPEVVHGLNGRIAELQAAYDELAAIAAQLCRACGFSMVDAAGEVIS